MNLFLLLLSWFLIGGCAYLAGMESESREPVDGTRAQRLRAVRAEQREQALQAEVARLQAHLTNISNVRYVPVVDLAPRTDVVTQPPAAVYHFPSPVTHQ